MNQTQYNTINNRETKLDILTLCDVTDTPLVSTLSKGFKIHSPIFEYYADRLKKPSRKTIGDGVDVDNFENKAKNRVVIQQRVQIMNEPWIVSKGQERDSDPAGVKNEVSRAKMISALELKRNMEASIGSDQEAVMLNEEQGNRFRGLGAFADSENENIPKTVRALAASTASTSTLNETAFRKVIQSVYEACGNPKGEYRLFAGPALQNKITGFSRTSDEESNILRAMRPAGSETIDCAVRIYNSDWGRIVIIPDLFLGMSESGDVDDNSRARGYLFDPKNVQLSFNEDLYSEEYPDLGGGKRGAIWSKFTLIQKMPRAMAMFN